MARLISTSLMPARPLMTQMMTTRQVLIQSIIKMPLKAAITIMGSGTTTSSSSHLSLKIARLPARTVQPRAHPEAEVTPPQA